MVGIARERKREPVRETIPRDVIERIIREQSMIDRRLFCRLILQYGLRRAETTRVQRKHFDVERKRLTVIGKGVKVRKVPIPDETFWRELDELTLECGWSPEGYLVHQVTITRERDGDGLELRERVVHHNDVPITPRGAHTRWYKCLKAAAIVPKDTRSGQGMHRGRHSAGQALLDATGNLKAVQKFLGHADIHTTGNIYVDWDEEQLAELMAGLFVDEAGD